MSSDPQREADIEILSDVLAGGLTGALSLDFAQASKLFGAAKRLGATREVPARALSKFIETHEDALPILAGALSAEAAAKLRAMLDERAAQAG